MKNESQMRGVAICPKLYYDDARAAIEWLERAFDFRKRLLVSGPDDSVVHAELSLDAAVVHAEPSLGAIVMIGSSRPEQKCLSPRRLAGVSQVLCVHVSDPDAHHARAKSAGARIVQEVMQESNGSRSYGALDPEGHHWHFGTYVPGAYWTE